VEEIRSLVTRAVAPDGDPAERLAAFGELVRRFQDMAYGYAYSIMGDFHLAEDAAQEAFLTAYLHLGELRQPAAFSGWLRRIVQTACSRLTRNSSPATVSLEAAGEIPAGDPSPAEMVEAIETRNEVLAAVRSLPTPERMVTTLFYINGYSHKEIADFLEVPVTTVNSRLAASRKRLRQRILNMVANELQANAPDDSFADKVIDELPERQDMLIFLMQLAEHVCAGRPLVESLRAIQNELVGKNLERAVRGVADFVEGGMILSEAMKRYPKTFHHAIVCFVEGGEYAGVLDSALLLMVHSAWQSPRCTIWGRPPTAKEAQDLFTENARRAMAQAKDEADRYKHKTVDTGHVLLGILHQETSLAAELLRRVGADSEGIRKEAEGLLKNQAESPTPDSMLYSEQTKKVLEHARQEVREFDQSYIGAEHLLLSLLSQEEGIAARALSKQNVSLAELRAALRKHIEDCRQS